MKKPSRKAKRKCQACMNVGRRGLSKDCPEPKKIDWDKVWEILRDHKLGRITACGRPDQATAQTWGCCKDVIEQEVERQLDETNS